jgi:hypothetical protein
MGEDVVRVLLIDADSTIPNIPLMKLSTHHKLKGDTVELVRLCLPYYPGKKKKKHSVPVGFDIVYCSVIFDGNKDCVVGDNIIFGGTGVDLKTKLSDEVERCECDYSLYPENDFSYGFITRGCIRKCSFCKVPEKEGHIRLVNDPEQIIRHKKVKFLDNNILAYHGHKDILKKLVDLKIRCQFNQGLDVRLVDEENSVLLSKLSYIGEYVFAFDNWRYRSVVERQLEMLLWRKPFQLKFFVYVHPSMDLEETLHRIGFLRARACLPFLMRDIACWNDERSDLYVDLAAYCNQPNMFKKMDFESFLNIRHKNQTRIQRVLSWYNEALKNVQ